MGPESDLVRPGIDLVWPGMLVDEFDNHGLALYLCGLLLLASTVVEVSKWPGC